MRRFTIFGAAAMLAMLCLAPMGYAAGGSGSGGGTGGGGGTSGGGGGTGGGGTVILPPFAMTLSAKPKSHTLSYGSSISFATTVTNGTSAARSVTLDYVITDLDPLPPYANCNNGRMVEIQATVAPGTIGNFSPSVAYLWCVANYQVTLVATDTNTHELLGTLTDTFSITSPTAGS